MSKSKLVFLLIFIGIVGGIFFVSHIYFGNNAAKHQSEASLKLTELLGFIPKGDFFISDYLDSKGCVAFDTIKAKHESLKKKVQLMAKTQSNADELWLRELQLITQSSDFKNLEQEGLKNNRCSGQTLDLLFYIYSSLKLPEKTAETKQRLLGFAAANNFSAIRALCLEHNYDALISQEDESKYCENIIENNDIDNNDTVKSLAYSTLAFDYDHEQKAKLLVLCKKVNALVDNDYSPFAIASSMCFSKMSVLALPYDTPFSKEDYKQILAMCDKSSNDIGKYDKSCDAIKKYYGMYLMQQGDLLFHQNNYTQAFELYREAADYDESGQAFAMMASMNNDGLGVSQNFDMAIIWYGQALKKMEKNNNTLGYMVAMNGVGLAYERLQRYTSAFECYHKAATMGDAESQFDLGRMFFLGRGAIQDNIKAFAWISAATAQGLPDKEAQSDAEKIKKFLGRLLAQTNQLNEATELAKQYYSEYVLHEQPTQ